MSFALLLASAALIQFSGSAPAQDVACAAPGGELGSCVHVVQCASAMRTLHKIMTYGEKSETVEWANRKEEIETLKKSRCTGPHEYSVCCARVPVAPEADDKCGWFVSERIIGGDISHIDSYPWLAIIEYKTAHDKKLLCGGSLINKRYVLTAAHCVRGNILNIGTPTTVRLGEFNLRTVKDCEFDFEEYCADPIQTIDIETTFVHPQYDEKTSKNDIALIKLKNDADYSDYVVPVCLPSSNVDLNNVNWFPVSGWGLTSNGNSQSDQKLQGFVNLIAPENCQDIKEKQLCTRSNTGKCIVDEGGPMMRLRTQSQTGNHEIVGVANHLPRDCSGNGTAVYTKVSEYVDWIINQIQQ